jgi:PIN domain nuclease of toxin-antitoxin system
VSSASDTDQNEGTQSVLDASAIIAWLEREPGYEIVEKALPGIVSAINLMEVVYIAERKGVRAEESRAVLEHLPLQIIPFDVEQAYTAAALHSRTREFGLSLGDCACVNLAASLGLPVLTADRQWLSASLPAKVILIR